jgi:hypothetical protein
MNRYSLVKIKLMFIIFLLTGICFGQHNFKAYYTKLSSGESWESDFRMGEHADIIVQMNDVGKFYFWRASSYLPRWETATTSTYISQAPVTFSGDGNGIRWDKLCRHSHVRIISTDDSMVVIHWRYAPAFDDMSSPAIPNWTGWIDEYYTVRSNYTFKRVIYVYDSGTKYTYECTLNSDGTIKENSLDKASFTLTAPAFNSSTILPEGPDLGFGASYTKLGFSGNWDNDAGSPSDVWNNNWQVADHPDVLVNFDGTSNKWVFWRGTNFIAHLVSENGAWYSNEFNETWGAPGMCSGGAEPMSDKQNRFAHVKIIENTPARVVVQYRYALIDNCYNLVNREDQPGEWADFSDWYYYIYPDGVAAQKNTLWSGKDHGNYEFQETMIIHSPGSTPYDNLERENCVTIANLDGESNSYSLPMPPTDEPFGNSPANANIQLVNLKDTDQDAFTIIEPGDDIFFATYMKEDGYFTWWNHWPVNNVESFGRNAKDSRYASHTSLSHIWIEGENNFFAEGGNYATKILLMGLSDFSVDDLALLGQSWLNAPSISHSSGVISHGYDKSERAYQLSSTSKNMSFTVEATSASVGFNPAFVIKNLGSDEPFSLSINGEVQKDSADFKQGVIVDTDGTETLIIWLNKKFTSQLEIKISTVI